MEIHANRYVDPGDAGSTEEMDAVALLRYRIDRAERASTGTGTSGVDGGESTGTWTATDRANPTQDAGEALLAAYREGVRTVGAALQLLSRQAPSRKLGTSTCDRF